MVYQVVSTANGPVHAAGGFCIHAKEIVALDHFSGGRFLFGIPEALRAFEDAGADAALIVLETAGEQEALAKLEELAQTVLPSPGRGV